MASIISGVVDLKGILLRIAVELLRVQEAILLVFQVVEFVDFFVRLQIFEVILASTLHILCVLEGRVESFLRVANLSFFLDFFPL